MRKKLQAEPIQKRNYYLSSSNDENASWRTSCKHRRNDQQSDFAGTELLSSTDGDSEIDFHYFPNCAQCGELNSNAFYSYCQKCFTMRKKLHSESNRKRNHYFSSLNEQKTSRRSPFCKRRRVDLKVGDSSNTHNEHSSEVQYLVTGRFFLI